MSCTEHMDGFVELLGSGREHHGLLAQPVHSEDAPEAMSSATMRLFGGGDSNAEAVRLIDDVLGDAERCGGGGGGGVEDVDHALRLNEVKVIDQRARRREGLSADARAGRNQIVRPQFGQQFLQRLHEGRLAERTMQLAQPRLPIARGHAPKADRSGHAENVAHRELSPRVPFALQREDGVWSGLDTAVNQAREMDAEKWKSRIGNGINQIADEMESLRG